MQKNTREEKERVSDDRQRAREDERYLIDRLREDRQRKRDR